MVVKDTSQTLEETRRCREQEHKEGKQGVRWLSRIRPRPWRNHGDVGEQKHKEGKRGVRWLSRIRPRPWRNHGDVENRNTRRGSRGLGGCQGYDPDPGGTTEM